MTSSIASREVERQTPNTAFVARVLETTEPALWFGVEGESAEEAAARLDAAVDILDELAHEFGAACSDDEVVWGWAA